jgi:hypothetical protein
MNAQDFQFLLDTLRHLSAEFFNQQTHTAVFLERENVKAHTLAPVKG